VALRVLVDADNVAPSRLQPVLDLIGALDPADVRLTASGRAQALARLRWPDGSELLEHAGWQRADLALASAYTPTADALILVSGDGDFAHLALRHPGPVLIVSGAAAGPLRDAGLVVDPATEGVGPIREWLAQHL
jgi:hypothetical protein